MNHKTIKIENGPSVEELFEACKFICECQTAVFTVSIEGSSHLLPCLVSGISAVNTEIDLWNVTLVIRHQSLVRLNLVSEHLKKIAEIYVSATYSTASLKGEITFPED